MVLLKISYKLFSDNYRIALPFVYAVMVVMLKINNPSNKFKCLFLFILSTNFSMIYSYKVLSRETYIFEFQTKEIAALINETCERMKFNIQLMGRSLNFNSHKKTFLKFKIEWRFLFENRRIDLFRHSFNSCQTSYLSVFFLNSSYIFCDLSVPNLCLSFMIFFLSFYLYLPTSL